MKKYPLIRTIYLYIFALLGLILITIGAVRFVNMAFRVFVFTQADQDQRHMNEPTMPYPYSYPPDRFGKISASTSTDAWDQKTLDEWRKEYKTWREEGSKINYLTVRRHQDASLNIALILVGLPLYFYHWRLIQKEGSDKA